MIPERNGQLTTVASIVRQFGLAPLQATLAACERLSPVGYNNAFPESETGRGLGGLDGECIGEGRESNSAYRPASLGSIM